jgi:hypothetical protein
MAKVKIVKNERDPPLFTSRQPEVSKWADTRYFYPPEIVYSTGRNY